MIKRMLLCASLISAMALLAQAKEWKGVPVVDGMCFAKVKADPDAHSRECALACAKSGYGIIAPDGSFLQFDEAGNAKLTKLLRDTKRKDHLRVTVDGEQKGNSISVTSVSLNQ